MSSPFVREHLARQEPEYVGGTITVKYKNEISFVRKEGKCSEFIKVNYLPREFDFDVVGFWLETIPKWLFDEDREFRFVVDKDTWTCKIGESHNLEIDYKKKVVCIKRKIGNLSATLFTPETANFSVEEFNNLIDALNSFLPEWHKEIEQGKADTLVNSIETDGIRERAHNPPSLSWEKG